MSGGVLSSVSSLFLLPVQKGDPKFSEGLLCEYKLCPDTSSPCLLISLLCDKEGLERMSSLISYGISL